MGSGQSRVSKDPANIRDDTPQLQTMPEPERTSLASSGISPLDTKPQDSDVAMTAKVEPTSLASSGTPPMETKPPESSASGTSAFSCSVRSQRTEQDSVLAALRSQVEVGFRRRDEAAVKEVWRQYQDPKTGLLMKENLRAAFLDLEVPVVDDAHIHVLLLASPLHFVCNLRFSGKVRNTMSCMTSTQPINVVQPAGSGQNLCLSIAAAGVD